jgi:hypothetical protein
MEGALRERLATVELHHYRGRDHIEAFHKTLGDMAAQRMPSRCTFTIDPSSRENRQDLIGTPPLWLRPALRDAEAETVGEAAPLIARPGNTPASPPVIV